MRRINRLTGKLSGNWKRHLKKVGRWDEELHCPTKAKDLPLGWVRLGELTVKEGVE